MKLTIPTALLSLFSALTHATVNISDVPSRLRVGQEVVLRWSSDSDYVRTRHFKHPHLYHLPAYALCRPTFYSVIIHQEPSGLTFSSSLTQRTKSLDLYQVRDNNHDVHHIHGIQHTRATLKGEHAELWKVPNVRKNGGCVSTIHIPSYPPNKIPLTFLTYNPLSFFFVVPFFSSPRKS